MLMFRAKPVDSWLPFVLENLPAVLVDHAHLERKAATTAITMQRYTELRDVLRELNDIAIEELQHFHLVLDLLDARGVTFTGPQHSPWISGLMHAMRKGKRSQVIDHLVCCALIEGRSCEKFQILADALRPAEPKLAQFYASLVESEGNHYATYLIMARDIDLEETEQRLDWFLDLEAELISRRNPNPMLH